MEPPVSSNPMGNLKKIDESEDSEDFDSDLNAGDDVSHMQMKPEHVNEIESDQKEVMSTRESEKPETEDEEPVVHPYANLVESFEYQKEQLEVRNVEPMKTLDQTEYEIIRTEGDLLKVIEELRSQKEISLVLQDFNHVELILVTIGTLEKEYLIDATQLNNLLGPLTEIFINPEIIKIVYNMQYVQFYLHNQHLYLVNVFDIKPAYFLKEKVEVSFNDLIERKYKSKHHKLLLKLIVRGRFSSKQIMYFRSRVHYLLYLYHDIKNYLLLNDEEGYMNLLEKMQKESIALKFDNSRNEILDPIRTKFIQHLECELDVLQKMDDWRVAKFGARFGCVESGLPKNDVIAIARELPWSRPALDELLSVTLAEEDKYAILIIVRQSRKKHFACVFPHQKRKRKPPTSVELTCSQQTINASKIQQNKKNIPKNFKPTNVRNDQLCPGPSTHDLQNKKETYYQLCPGPSTHDLQNRKETYYQLCPGPSTHDLQNRKETYYQLCPGPSTHDLQNRKETYYQRFLNQEPTSSAKKTRWNSL